ncbi:hypothetical protein LPB140_04670 [Sphingorhabdus lutea]|uniref:Bax inhibitor-1/YccA family protein n=1 Tax=Sphingorhabdus lutea TaxID=1913578 RepID=A0A1L3JAQ8_9SPHN|nr:Bax inhibitor-1/YccA family protein [Sphingorhabdus lutea]APG62212.1 hypothetical protein LPB140_04670 [Sphingorhabdus lutea]
MAEWPNQNSSRGGYDLAGNPVSQSAAVDAGLRSHMLKVYNYMASAVLLTGIVAMLFAQSEFGQNLFYNPSILTWVLIFSPLIMIFAISFGINKMSQGTLQAMFWTFAVLMGLSMASIFLRFTDTSIARTFFATSAAFAGLSLYGYTTKKDLSGMGSFLIMGVIGLIVASLINIFLQSSGLQWAISFLGVLIFAGLTAYDTQQIKNTYLQLAGTEFVGKAAIMGALNLYLDFVNMFQFLLNFMGSSE